MKKVDRFLIGIVVGVVLLVAATLIVTLRQPSSTYQPEDTPAGVAYNYLLALQQEDFPRAYSYLSPTIPGYPANNDNFTRNVRGAPWSFRFDADTAVSITNTQLNGDQAIVHVAATRFHQAGLFDSNTTTTSFTIELRRQGNAWKIWSATRYWAGCWSREEGCK